MNLANLLLINPGESLERWFGIMKVLMIGWELPPFHSGGLGPACLGLAEALAKQGVDLTFVLPNRQKYNRLPFKVMFADWPHRYPLPSNYADMQLTFSSNQVSFSGFSPDLAFAYADRVSQLAAGLDFDLIHAQDWICFPAGVVTAHRQHKPLATHVHITEYDKNGGLSLNRDVIRVEKQGMNQADRVIAVSGRVKATLTDHYQVNQNKIDVVYNAVDQKLWTQKDDSPTPLRLIPPGGKMVLSLGRLTIQKGIDYLIRAAAKVIAYDPGVYFVIVGSGSMHQQLIELTYDLGIADHVIFTGWLSQNQSRAIYRAADLFVLPSVSEPFGLVPLESLICGTPVLITKQSGVCEVLNHALTVDYWDTNLMAAKILSALKYRPVHRLLVKNGRSQAESLTWDKSADQCLSVYRQML